MGRSRVVLQNPKYIENLGAAVRACACWGAETLTYTGSRIQFGDRTPRELRMKDYASVEVVRTERPFDYTAGFVPVCVEILPGSISLRDFQHPPNATYIFGPEDGDVSQVFRRFCHHFVQVPSKFCLNLAATVNVVLYDRFVKET